MTPSTNTKVLLGTGLLLVVMVVAMIYQVGSKHLSAVREVNHLHITNQVLVETVQEKIPSLEEDFTIKRIEDSLKTELTRRDSVISYLRQSLTLTKNQLSVRTKQLEDEKLNSVTNPYNSVPYDFSPAELPDYESDQRK